MSTGISNMNYLFISIGTVAKPTTLFSPPLEDSFCFVTVTQVQCVGAFYCPTHVHTVIQFLPDLRQLFRGNNVDCIPDSFSSSKIAGFVE
jgi:hypothetical protein